MNRLFVKSDAAQKTNATDVKSTVSAQGSVYRSISFLLRPDSIKIASICCSIMPLDVFRWELSWALNDKLTSEAGILRDLLQDNSLPLEHFSGIAITYSAYIVT
jgi:hypothetical protein